MSGEASTLAPVRTRTLSRVPFLSPCFKPMSLEERFNLAVMRKRGLQVVHTRASIAAANRTDEAGPSNK